MERNLFRQLSISFEEEMDDDSTVCRDGVCFFQPKKRVAQVPVPPPTPGRHWTVYGRHNCGFCTAASNWLDQHEANYTYYDVEKYGGGAYVRTQLPDVPPTHRTVPMVFWGDRFIGGYQQLRKEYETLIQEAPVEKVLSPSVHINTQKMPLVGGISDPKEMTDEVRELTESFREKIMEWVVDEADSFIPLNFATQVVAGTNFYVKVQVNKDPDRCIHVRIFRPLPHTGEEPSLGEKCAYPTTSDAELKGM